MWKRCLSGLISGRRLLERYEWHRAAASTASRVWVSDATEVFAAWLAGRIRRAADRTVIGAGRFGQLERNAAEHDSSAEDWHLRQQDMSQICALMRKKKLTTIFIAANWSFFVVNFTE